jgi:hypothetical protein
MQNIKDNESGNDSEDNGWKEVPTRRSDKDDGDKRADNGVVPIDGPEELNLLIDSIDMCFMCGNGFDAAGGIRSFITDGQGYNKKIVIIATSGDGQYIMWATDVPTTCEGIESYYRYNKGSNNVAGRIKNQTKYSISQLKQQSTLFKQYLLKYRVHINNAQLEEKEGITLG